MKKHSSKEAYFERLRNLADVNKLAISESQNRNLGTLIDYKRAADGTAYGIIKENHNYYIKKAGLKQDPDVSDFAYIGGLSNVTEYQYQKLSEADKQRNLLLHVISESLNTKQNPNGGGKKKLNEGAGDEIAQAEEKLDDLDTATDAQTEVPANPAGDEFPANPEADTPPAGDEFPANPEADTNPADDMPASPEADVNPADDELPADDEKPGDETSDDEPDADADDTQIEPEDDKSLTEKEIEKSLGKITNKIRKLELEPESIKSYVNTFLSAFKNKFDGVDIEDRKSMADKILKVVPDEDVENLSSDVPQNDENSVEEGKMCSECGGFAQFAESRGYNAKSIQECGDEEMGNLISGYANAHNDGQNDGDFKAVALFITPEIMNSLKNDYGHEEYAEKLAPHVDSLSESSVEDKTAQINELFGGLGQLGKSALKGIGSGLKAGYDMAAQGVKDAAKGVQQTYYTGEKNAALKRLEGLAQQLNKEIKLVHNSGQKAGQEPLNVQSLLQTITSGLQSKGAADLSKFRTENVDPASVEVQPSVMKEDGEESEEEVTFAPEAQSLGVGTIKPDGAPTTGVDININPDKSVKISMNESEQKLRKYIRSRLEEKIGLKKVSLNENKKSEAMKKLDKIIDEQFKLSESVMKNEGFLFTSNAERFEKLNPNNPEDIEKTFYTVFKDALNGRFKAFRTSWARQMSPEVKYKLLKQGYDTDKLKMPDFIQSTASGFGYQYKPMNLENPFGGGGTGGGNFSYGGSTGT